MLLLPHRGLSSRRLSCRKARFHSRGSLLLVCRRFGLTPCLGFFLRTPSPAMPVSASNTPPAAVSTPSHAGVMPPFPSAAMPISTQDFQLSGSIAGTPAPSMTSAPPRKPRGRPPKPLTRPNNRILVRWSLIHNMRTYPRPRDRMTLYPFIPNPLGMFWIRSLLLSPNQMLLSLPNRV